MLDSGRISSRGTAWVVKTVPVVIVAFSLALLCAAPGWAQSNAGASWKFAVSGDSRNCGDIVMPAIAQGVLRDGAGFYWHLGDYRAIYKIDEDYHQTHPDGDLPPDKALSRYQKDAWSDFIQHQLQPFGNLPVFLELGNHELMLPLSRSEYLARFGKWFDTPVLREQRLADAPGGDLLQTYYHWIDRGVDFISMDNASPDQFNDQQLNWFRNVLRNAATNQAVHTVVLGMHAALPDSLSAGHSMNDSATQESSGRQVYAELLAFQHRTKKHVYVLSSHSHFVINNVYATACRPKSEVVTGWIIGTAGAVRYRLPQEHSAATVPKTDVYGYLLGTVAGDGTISFDFKEISRNDVSKPVVDEFSPGQVDWCFDKNTDPYVPVGAACGSAPENRK